VLGFSTIPLFGLDPPLSFLMQSIELDIFDHTAGAAPLRNITKVGQSNGVAPSVLGTCAQGNRLCV